MSESQGDNDIHQRKQQADRQQETCNVVRCPTEIQDMTIPLVTTTTTSNFMWRDETTNRHGYGEKDSVPKHKNHSNHPPPPYECGIIINDAVQVVVGDDNRIRGDNNNNNNNNNNMMMDRATTDNDANQEDNDAVVVVVYKDQVRGINDSIQQINPLKSRTRNSYERLTTTPPSLSPPSPPLRDNVGSEVIGHAHGNNNNDNHNNNIANVAADDPSTLTFVHDSVDPTITIDFLKPIEAELVVDDIDHHHHHTTTTTTTTTLSSLPIATPLQKQYSKKLLLMIGSVVLLIIIIIIVVVVVVTTTMTQLNSHSTPSVIWISNTVIPTSSPTNPTKDWKQVGNDLYVGYFGPHSVAISHNGTTLGIGYPYFGLDGKGGNFAATYVINSTGGWDMTSQLFINKKLYHSVDMSGYTVALDETGLIMAVGYPTADYNKSDGRLIGMVRVYRRDSELSNFIQMGSDIVSRIHDSGWMSWDLFGWSVDLSNDGTIVAVGSRANYVQVYHYNDTMQEWFEYGNSIVTSSEGYIVVDTGLSVRLSGDGSIVMVGDPVGYTKNYTECGSMCTYGIVNVYQMNVSTNTWIPMGETIKGAENVIYFGSSIAISDDGSIIVTCSPNDNINYHAAPSDMGSCRSYRYDDTDDSWQPFGQMINGTEIGEYFGSSCDLNANGDVLAIGASANNGQHGDNTGKVQIYQWEESALLWKEMGHDIMGQYSYESLGTALASSHDGTRMAIATSTGAVRLYEYTIVS